MIPLRWTLAGWILALAIPKAPTASAQPAVHTASVLVDCWSANSGQCPTPGSSGATTDYSCFYGTSPCTFSDPLPPGATIQAITATQWLTRAATSTQGMAAFTFLNGEQIGGQQIFFNRSVCGSGAFMPYQFHGTPATYRYGTANELGVQLVQTDGGHACLELVELEIEYAPPPPFDFEIKDLTPEPDRRVLIAKHRDDTTYTSHFQNLLARDGEIPVAVRVNDADGPVAGATVFFRVLDPPDTSRYVPVASQTANDNRDPNPPVLAGSGVLPVEGTPGVVSAVSNSEGMVRLELRVTDRYAGDNYIIEGSRTPDFSCNDDCGRSGILTAWKRVYVERDVMRRGGAPLAASVGAGQTVVRVRESQTRLRRNDTITLLHAPFRDGTGPLATSGRVDLGFWSEVAVIQAVTRDRDPNNRGGDVLTLTAPLQHSYYVDNSTFAGGRLDYLNDAVAIRDNDPNREAFTADISRLAPAFAEAYVEYVVLGAIENPSASVPWIPAVDNSQITLLAGKWFENADHSPDPTGGLRLPVARPNHQYLLAASRFVNPQLLNTFALGTTVNGGGGNYSYVWAETIELACTVRNFSRKAPLLIYGQDADIVNSETVVHELAHQFDVNPPEITNGGHCSACPTPATCVTKPIYSQHPAAASGATCIMSAVSDQNAGDGVVAFHYDSAAAAVDSEYITIRTMPDPLP